MRCSTHNAALRPQEPHRIYVYTYTPAKIPKHAPQHTMSCVYTRFPSFLCSDIISNLFNCALKHHPTVQRCFCLPTAHARLRMQTLSKCLYLSLFISPPLSTSYSECKSRLHIGFQHNVRLRRITTRFYSMSTRHPKTQSESEISLPTARIKLSFNAYNMPGTFPVGPRPVP